MIVDVAKVDRVPQALGLQLDAHDDHPIRVIGACQYRVLGTTASLSDDPLTHHHLVSRTTTSCPWRLTGLRPRRSGEGEALRRGERDGDLEMLGPAMDHDKALIPIVGPYLANGERRVLAECSSNDRVISRTGPVMTSEDTKWFCAAQ